MPRHCRAVITVATGRHGTRQFPVQRVETYTTDQSIDNDADSFSFDVGDSDLDLNLVMDRDNEVRVALYIDDPKQRLVPIFNGIVDVPQWDETKVISMEGRDTPSSLAVDSDAMPGRWKHVQPATFIEQRAKALGIVYTSLPKLSAINSLYTDGSEKEWAFWYRIARMKECYMWSDEVGRLIIAKLGYALTPTYRFGVATKGSKGAWIPCERISQSSNKQARKRRL
jgi:prophage tail gpP-like protein